MNKNTMLDSQITHVAVNSAQSSYVKIIPYAIVKQDTSEPGGDDIMLVIHIDASPTPVEELSDPKRPIPVTLFGGLATWVNAKGIKQQIGEPGKQLAQNAQDAMRREAGLLVLFIDDQAEPVSFCAFEA